MTRTRCHLCGSLSYCQEPDGSQAARPFVNCPFWGTEPAPRPAPPKLPPEKPKLGAHALAAKRRARRRRPWVVERGASDLSLEDLELEPDDEHLVPHDYARRLARARLEREAREGRDVELAEEAHRLLRRLGRVDLVAKEMGLYSAQVTRLLGRHGGRDASDLPYRHVLTLRPFQRRGWEDDYARGWASRAGGGWHLHPHRRPGDQQ